MYTDIMTGSTHQPSHVPNVFLDYSDRMNFIERLHNFVTWKLDEAFLYFYHFPKQKKLYEAFFPKANLTFDKQRKNLALLFNNNHFSSSTVRPGMPNIIDIGGNHVEPAKPLPSDIQQFLDSAEHGAILFSMGSIIQAVQWPIEKREAFIKAFGKLKQKVLWKYENDTLPNKPSNVMISKWIPQRDILAHPNMKLFITHGGLLGTTEAMVEGVPVLGIPIFGDQKMNMAKAVTRDYGLQIYNEDITAESFSNVLTEFFSNPKYSINAKQISERFSDRPMTPQQTVIFWTEYALRHKGAHHLRAAGNSLTFVEFHLLDVYLTLIAIGLIVLYLNYLSLKFVLRKIFKPKSSVKVKRN
jgi:glucuronosyltransferase